MLKVLPGIDGRVDSVQPKASGQFGEGVIEQCLDALRASPLCAASALIHQLASASKDRPRVMLLRLKQPAMRPESRMATRRRPCRDHRRRGRVELAHKQLLVGLIFAMQHGKRTQVLAAGAQDAEELKRSEARKGRRVIRAVPE